MPRQKLTREMKLMITVQLAMFNTPSKVRDMVQEEYGVKLRLNTIVYYDPTTADSKVAKEYRDLFEKTREKFITDCARVPIMHKAYRARALQRILDEEFERKNTVGARETLEQAAKEEGGVFTNRRELTGKDGAQLPVAALTVAFVQPGGDGAER
jgi:hypothetical protein